LKEIEERNNELPNIETGLNSLRTRCGLTEVKAIAKQFTSVQKKLKAIYEKAKKVK